MVIHPVRIAVLAACVLGAAAGFSEKQTLPLVFYHEDKATKQLDELKRLYDFDEYVAKGKDEYERMALLQRWTFDTVVYGGAKQYTELRNALTILQKAKKGEVFWCGNIAAVYMQCALAMGWTPRYVIMRNDKGEGHYTNDIWSNQYKKWIMMDATWNIRIEKDGVPLSLLEIRDEWIKNKGADLVYVYGAGDNEKRYTKAMLPIVNKANYLYKFWPVTDTWISLTWELGFIGRNNLFTTADGSGAHIWETIYTMRHPAIPDDPGWGLNRYPAPPLEAIFHDLNTVILDVKPEAGKDSSFVVTMNAFGKNNYTPNFESYEYRIDGGEWKDAGPTVKLSLEPGQRVIEARIRNKFGVRGPETRAEVEVKGGLGSLLLRLRRWFEG